AGDPSGAAADAPGIGQPLPELPGFVVPPLLAIGPAAGDAGLAYPDWLTPHTPSATDLIADAYTDVAPSPKPSRLIPGSGPIEEGEGPGTPGGIALASANSLADPPTAEQVADAARGARLARAERMAGEARTLGDLTKLIALVCDGRTQREGAGPGPPTLHGPELASVAAWAFNRRGELRAEAGDERLAFDDFQTAIALDARCWAALHNRGVTLARYGHTAEALDDFTRAVRINPDFTPGFANRAELLLQAGQPAAAEQDFSRVLADLPGDARLLAGRAQARAALGRRDDAVRDLNAALRAEPDSAARHAQRGVLFAEAGHYEQAVADFDAALRLDGRCVPAYQGVAWLLATCPDPHFRDPAKALAAAVRAVTLGDASDGVLLATAAAASAAAGQFDQAVRYQQQAILLLPPDARPTHQQRLALYRAGKPYLEAAVTR
ncbi:MAG: tetratricopeptide repeat protein, partial [Planctomycetota bacterium]